MKCVITIFLLGVPLLAFGQMAKTAHTDLHRKSGLAKMADTFSRTGQSPKTEVDSTHRISPYFAPVNARPPRTAVPLTKKLELDLYPQQHYPNVLPQNVGGETRPAAPVLKN